MTESMRPQPILDMVLFATNRCNLRCAYCYEPGGNNESLTPEIGEQAVRWFLDQGEGAGRDPMIGFYGGEPLVCYDLVRHLIDFGHQEAASRGRRLRFGITTNGTLLTADRLRFLERRAVSLIVSIDGTPEVHDRFRRNAAGRGSFAALDDLLPALAAHRPGTFVRLTTNPETVHLLADGVRFLVAAGFSHLAVAANVETEWRRQEWAAFDAQCREVADLYLERFLAGEKIWLNFVDDNLRILLRGRRPAASCGAGKTLVGVSVRGEIFPCHRFVSRRGFAGSHRLGDVWSGLDEEARRPFARFTSEHCLGCRTPCRQCPAHDVCGGACIAKAEEYNSNFLVPLEREQYVYSIWAELVRDVLGFFESRDVPLFRQVFAPVAADRPRPSICSRD